MNSNPVETIEQPLVQINCFAHLVTLSRVEENGRISTYPIRLEELALHLNHISLSSGFLPKDVLAWGRQGTDDYLVWYMPRRIYDVTVVVGRRKSSRLRIPLPAAVLVGNGKKYAAFAVKQRPRDASARLYHFPSPNVGHNDNICRGSAEFPIASAQTMPDAWRAFVSSGFNDHAVTNRCQSEPEDVLKLWRRLHKRKAKTFPNLELVSAEMRLHHVFPE